jgi:DNA mismatch repair ATPase MutS
VSTHDLGLAEVAGLREAAVPVYFREHVERDGADGRPRISFDYRMRPGIATTRNALKLLEAVGLSVPEGLGAEEAAVQGKTPKRSDPSTGSGRPTEDSR